MANDAKRYGASLPENPIPSESIGFFICIPDTLEYRAAMRGAIDRFAQWFYWEHTSADFAEIPTANQEAAQVWGNAGATMMFLDDCEFPMSCEQIIQCIENNPATQQAIFDYLATSEAFKDFVKGQSATPVLPVTETGKNILKPNQCDPDYLFSEITALVQVLNAATEDLFQALEVGTNALERASLIVSAIPVLGAVVPVDEVLGGIDTVVESVGEDYTGAWTITLEDEIRCAIFCDIKDTCVLNLDAIIAYYEQQVPAQLSSDPLQFVVDLFDFLATGNTPNSISVYAMHLLVLAAMRAASNVLGTDFTRLILRVQAAGDTANNDWVLLCDNCPPETNCDDFTQGKQNWETYPYASTGLEQGVYLAGQGWKQADLGIYGLILRIRKTMTDAIDSIEIFFDAPTTSSFQIIVSSAATSGDGFSIPLGATSYLAERGNGWGTGQYEIQLYAPSSPETIISQLCYEFTP